jgi:hypothetical protein
MKTPLTKTRFMKGVSCSAKLRFNEEKIAAQAETQDDAFLQALAQGGFQVEALARMHYPDGIFINTKPHQYEKAAKLTQEALLKDDVVLFEAAFLIDGYFVRTDILEKKGNKIKIIEVKAKSYEQGGRFLTASGTILKEWEDKLWDLAYQKFVAMRAFPDFEFEASFMFADKTKKASVDGMNQLFRIPVNGNPRTDLVRKVNQIEDLGNSILTLVDEVDQIVDDILDEKLRHSISDNWLRTTAIDLRDYLQKKNWGSPGPEFKKCKNCEFRTVTTEDGFVELSECFKYIRSSYSASMLRKPTIFEIWDYKNGPHGGLTRGNLFLEDMTAADFNIEDVELHKIARRERQWLQVTKTVKNDNTLYVEKEGLLSEMKNWNFPLHFIDFETSGAALPFTKNMSPYEQVAFQFSHHIVLEDGTINHQTEYINNTPGEFPNFSFARALYQALKNDTGTIFRYHNHENTILNVIIRQLEDSQEPDATELITFLKSITKSTGKSAVEWKGERAMVDLHRLIKEYYYNPLTKGSISLKYMLPACLNTSDVLKRKYSQPIANVKVSSKNFDGNHVWLKTNGEEVQSPYQMLPPLFDNWDLLDLQDNVSEMEGVADGGAALTAYAKLQYQDMSDKEREEITKGLLKYCELDTLAMVMVYEHLVEITK